MENLENKNLGNFEVREVDEKLSNLCAYFLSNDLVPKRQSYSKNTRSGLLRAYPGYYGKSENFYYGDPMQYINETFSSGEESGMEEKITGEASMRYFYLANPFDKHTIAITVKK